jgi:hypothetical protein
MEREATAEAFERFISDAAYRRDMRRQVRELQEQGLLSAPV